MLNFGLKRIVKKLLAVNVLWVLIFFLFEMLRLNSFGDLLKGAIRMPDFWVIYCVPTLVLIAYDCFYERIIRLESKDGIILVTGLKFFFMHTLKIVKEDTTYKITLKKGIRSKHIRSLRIYDKSIEKYIIKEYDLNSVEMDQTIAFFKIHLPVNAKLHEA